MRIALRLGGAGQGRPEAAASEHSSGIFMWAHRVSVTASAEDVALA